MNLNTKWLKAALIRAIKTVCQSAVAMIAIDQAIYSIDWRNVIAVSLTAGVFSILTSVAGLPEVQDE